MKDNFCLENELRISIVKVKMDDVTEHEKIRQRNIEDRQALMKKHSEGDRHPEEPDHRGALGPSSSGGQEAQTPRKSQPRERQISKQMSNRKTQTKKSRRGKICKLADEKETFIIQSYCQDCQTNKQIGR